MSIIVKKEARRNMRLNYPRCRSKYESSVIKIFQAPMVICGILCAAESYIGQVSAFPSSSCNWSSSSSYNWSSRSRSSAGGCGGTARSRWCTQQPTGIGFARTYDPWLTEHGHHISPRLFCRNADDGSDPWAEHHRVDGSKPEETRDRDDGATMSLVPGGATRTRLSRSSFLGITASIVASAAVGARPSHAYSASPPRKRSTATDTVSTVRSPDSSALPLIPTATTTSTTISTTISTSAKTSERETFLETISGAFSGAALTTTKTLFKYPLDTATVRLQLPSSPYSLLRNPLQLFNGSFRGISSVLVCNVPAGAVFFAIKDFTRSVLREQTLLPLPAWAVTCVAVGVAQPPYWLVRNPSEVVKTRQQAGMEGYVTQDGEGGAEVTALGAFRRALQGSNDGGGTSGIGSDGRLRRW